MTSIAVRVKKAAKNRIDRHNQFGLRFHYVVPTMLITVEKVTLMLKKRVQLSWTEFVKTPPREELAWYDECAELKDKMMGQIEKKRGKREKAKSWKLREMDDQ
ncbi:hypothetical protein niasHT_029551 [Heterodera trifolii]|uniref:Uncharacterized protein n=1 Tax=Heterodera trifolii TaxID=157864 RepID=A0ABD2JB62_9BILA